MRRGRRSNESQMRRAQSYPSENAIRLNCRAALITLCVWNYDLPKAPPFALIFVATNVSLKFLLTGCLFAGLLSNAITLFAQPAPAPEIRGSAAYVEAFNHVRKRRFDEARQSLRALDDKIPAQYAERLAIEAWMQFMRCRFDTSEAKALAALQSAPNQPLAAMLLARIAEGKNQSADAVRFARLVMNADPNNAVLLARLTSVFSDPRDFPTRLQLHKHLAALVDAPEFESGRKRTKNNFLIQTKLNGRPTDEIIGDNKRMEVPFIIDATRRPQIELALPDGTRSLALLDTGANVLTLDARTAQSLPREKLADDVIYTIAGEGAAEAALLESFTLGGMRWRNVTCSVSSKYPQTLIGIGIFQHTVLVMDNSRSVLLAYADPAQFDREWGANLQQARRVEFVLIGSSILIPCTLTVNDAAEARGAILFDTGANNTTLSKRFADRWSREQGVRLDPIAARRIGGAAEKGQVVNEAVSNVTLHAGAMKFAAPQMNIMDLGSVQQSAGVDFAVLMGTDQMLHHQFIVIDFPRRAVYFGPAR